MWISFCMMNINDNLEQRRKTAAIIASAYSRLASTYNFLSVRALGFSISAIPFVECESCELVPVVYAKGKILLATLNIIFISQ